MDYVLRVSPRIILRASSDPQTKPRKSPGSLLGVLVRTSTDDYISVQAILLLKIRAIYIMTDYLDGSNFFLSGLISQNDVFIS